MTTDILGTVMREHEQNVGFFNHFCKFPFVVWKYGAPPPPFQGRELKKNMFWKVFR